MMALFLVPLLLLSWFLMMCDLPVLWIPLLIFILYGAAMSAFSGKR